ncbi:MAG: hypothetical protein ABIQ39_07160, partial [Ilumatobacteraceae bacterium]
SLGRGPDRSNRNEAMLRVFFLWTLNTQEAVTVLEREADAYRESHAALEALDGVIPWDASGSDRMGRIALEQGLRWSAMMCDWATWAADELRAGHNAPSLSGRRTVKG